MLRGFGFFTRYALCFIVLLFFVSCEEAETPSPSTSGRPEGIVQSRVTADGQVQVALALAPKKSQGRAPTLNAWRDRNLFDAIDQQAQNQNDAVRARGTIPNINGLASNLGYVYVSCGYWILETHFMRIVAHLFNEGWASVDQPLCYASDDFASWGSVHDITSGPKQFSIEHGDFKATAELILQGNTLFAKINDNPSLRFVAEVPPGMMESWKRANIFLVIPLERGIFNNGMSNELMAEYVGEWTVNASPPVVSLPNGRGETPFAIQVRALIVDGVSAQYRPDIEIPNSEEKHSGGAAFSGVAKMIGGYPHNYRERPALYWKARVFPEESPNDSVRTYHGTSAFVSEGTPIAIDWDGKHADGSPAPGDIKYGVAITAALASSGQDPKQIDNAEIITITPGAGPADIIHDATLEISPDPYIPYTPEELAYTYDGDGMPMWPDDDGDGYPDRFPDHDNDGVPDLEPGEEPPPMNIYADVTKVGYTTSWVLQVYTEEGEEITNEYEPWNGPPWMGDESVNVNWYPPTDLEPQTLTFKLNLTRCRTRPYIQILAQKSSEVCINVGPKIKEVQLGSGLSLSVMTNPELDPENPFLGPLSSGLIGSSDPGGDALEEILKNVCRDRRVEISLKGVPQGLSEIPCVITNGTDVKTVQLVRGPTAGKLEARAEIPQNLIDGKPDFSGIADDLEGEMGDLFFSLMSALPDSANFPSPRAARGRTFGTPERVATGSQRREMLNNNIGFTSIGTLRSCGFQTLRAVVNYTDPRSGKKVQLIAKFKVQNTASTLLLSSANSKERLVLDNAVVSPLTMALSGVHTLILGESDALRIRNYDVPRHVLPDDQDIAWGAVWDAKRGSSGAVFLGYRFEPPKEAVFKQVLQAYFEKVRELESQGISNARREAWLMANYANWSAMQACVLDHEGFHYIHGGWEYNEEGDYRNSPRRGKSFVTIYRQDWAKPRPQSVENPPTFGRKRRAYE